MKRTNFKINNNKNHLGFTLIELLIVISVIGVLAGIILTVVDPNSIRSRARDSQRVSDLGKIQNALELYYQDNRDYPHQNGWMKLTGTDNVTNLLSPNYTNDFPQDPMYNSLSSDNPCGTFTEGHFRYNYRTDADFQKYILTAIMENAASAEPSECGSLNNWDPVSGCAAIPNVCYGVENP